MTSRKFWAALMSTTFHHYLSSNNITNYKLSNNLFVYNRDQKNIAKRTNDDINYVQDTWRDTELIENMPRSDIVQGASN